MTHQGPTTFPPGEGKCFACGEPWPCPEALLRQAETEAEYREALIPKADPDRACEHEDFHAHFDVGRMAASDDDPTIVGFVAEVTIRCVRCDEPFRFIGMPAGMIATGPACSPDETEARLPIRPASSDSDFGLGLPGFAVRWREPRTCDEDNPRHEQAVQLATNLAMGGIALGMHGIGLGEYDCAEDPLGLRDAAMHATIALACQGLLDYDAVLADDQ